MQNVWMYIDGFNFYYAIKKGGMPLGLGWCDFAKLGAQMLDGEGVVERIKYFTSPVKNTGCDGERERQALWLEAASTIPGLETVSGFHVKDHNRGTPRKEKQTDVNIAVELVLDAVDPDGYSKAILLTGDIDLAPAVRAVLDRVSRGHLVDVWTPPGRLSEPWLREGRRPGCRAREIGLQMLADSRLPDRIPTASGKRIDCPPEWRMP